MMEMALPQAFPSLEGPLHGKRPHAVLFPDLLNKPLLIELDQRSASSDGMVRQRGLHGRPCRSPRGLGDGADPEPLHVSGIGQTLDMARRLSTTTSWQSGGHSHPAKR